MIWPFPGCGGGGGDPLQPVQVDPPPGPVKPQLPEAPVDVPLSFLQGKVSFTFDDGVVSIYKYAVPILAAENIPGTAYITTGWIGEAGYMNWDEVRSLQNDYHWEIGSHTLTHAELPTIAAYNQEIIESKQILMQQGLNIGSIATPYGAYHNRIIETISRHYVSHRGFWDRDDLNAFPYNHAVLMVESVQRDTSLQHIYDLLDRAGRENKWLILVFHEVSPEKIAGYVYTTTPADLQAIVSYTISIGLPVVSPGHLSGLREYNLLPATPARISKQAVSDQRAPDAWGRDHDNIGVAENTGRFPGTDRSISFAGSATEIGLWTPAVAVRDGKSYVVKYFANLLELSAGEVTAYVHEYNPQGEPVFMIPLGAAPGGQIKEINHRYTPSGPDVARAGLRIRLSAGASGSAVLDDFQLYQLP